MEFSLDTLVAKIQQHWAVFDHTPMCDLSSLGLSQEDREFFTDKVKKKLRCKKRLICESKIHILDEKNTKLVVGFVFEKDADAMFDVTVRNLYSLAEQIRNRKIK